MNFILIPILIDFIDIYSLSGHLESVLWIFTAQRKVHLEDNMPFLSTFPPPVQS